MSDSRITDLLGRAGKTLLSFEFYPPKDEAAMTALRTAAARLLAAKPDFVTCTYGAGGSTRGRTLEVCELLRDIGHGPVMPHLTCVGSSTEDVAVMADTFYDRGFRNIMALRGDAPKGDAAFKAHAGGPAHASDLVGLLKMRLPDVCLGVAGYPETHPEASSPEDDLNHLKAKVDAGGDFITTQLFYDNRLYFDFVARCRAKGIAKPVLPGLLPAISLKQVERMCAMCKATVPAALARAMEAAGGDGEAAEYVGIRWAERQIEELRAAGVPGIHLYILNRTKAALGLEMVRFFDSSRR